MGATTMAAAPAYAVGATVDLGDASSFAVLANSTVTNTGPSVISGDVGVSPGTAVTGFPTGNIINGTLHIADGVAGNAQSALTTAYNDAAGRTGADVTGQDLGTLGVLTPGVYEDSSAMSLTGTVTLDGQGDPNAVFIFNAGSTLATASGSTVLLVNGASPGNVFWQVGSSATLGTGTQLVGNILALASITLTTGADVQGRVLARNGAVTLDTNDVTAPNCAPATIPTGTPTGTPTSTPTSGPADTPTSGPTDTPTSGPADTPTSGSDTGGSDTGSGTGGSDTGGSDTGGSDTGGSDTGSGTGGSDTGSDTGSGTGGSGTPRDTGADTPTSTGSTLRTPTDVSITTVTKGNPTVPEGHPETGGGGTATSTNAGVLLVLGGLLAAGSVLSAGMAARAARNR